MKRTLAICLLLMALLASIEPAVGGRERPIESNTGQKWQTDLEPAIAERDRLIKQQKVKEALPWAQRVVDVLRKGKPGSLDLALSLDVLGRVAYLQRDLRGAEVAWSEAADLTGKLEPDSPNVAKLLWNLGIVAFDRANLVEAERRLKAARAIEQKLSPGSQLLADIMNMLGDIGYKKREYAEAQGHYASSLAICRNIDSNSLDVARCLNKLADTSYQRADFFGAREYYAAALVIFEKHSSNSLDLSHSLNGLGQVAIKENDIDGAQVRFQSALSMACKLRPSGMEVAMSLNGLGIVARAKGDLDNAQRRFEAVLAIDKQLDSKGDNMAATLNNLGTVALARGDLEGAKKLFEAALPIGQGAFASTLNHAISLTNLGHVAYLKNAFDNAKTHFEMALAIQKIIAPSSLEVAMSLNNLGVVANACGDFPRAQRWYEATLPILEGIAPGSLRMATTLGNLGSVAYSLGDLEVAQRRCEAGLAIQERLAPGSMEATLFLDILIDVALSRGDRVALKTLATKRLELAAHLLINQGASRAGELGRIGDEASVSLSSLGLLVDQVKYYNWLPTLRSAGLTLQVRAASSERAAQRDEEVRKARSEIHVSTNLEIEWATNPRPKDIDERAWNDELLDRRARRQSAELNLATLLKARDSRLTTDLKIEVTNVQNAIPEGTALIEYLKISTWDQKAKKPGEDGYGAFIVQRKGEVKFVNLGSAEKIYDLVEVFQAQMARATDSGATDSSLVETQKELIAIGGKLYDNLIKPLGKLPPNLLIAPDDRLHALPYGALVDGRGKHLVETTSISIVGSGRDLVEKPITGEPGPAAVIAGPDFGADAKTVQDANVKAVDQTVRAFNAKGEWEPLPSAGAEGEAIAKVLGTEPITGDKATEERLLSLERPRVLHIGTHGFFFPPTVERKEREEMLMKDMTGRGIRGADNPMLRSGLILAGANKDEELRKAGLADGWATSLEISQMDLRGTELVVLSACETGRGDVKGAEGVFGLQRAFRFAGAQTLVMSLFKVPDDSTRIMMENFYKTWKPGAPAGTKQKALRDAQLAMLKNPKTRHPRNWAGFVLMGER